jgi:DNA-binding FadR family transcriptional regulator
MTERRNLTRKIVDDLGKAIVTQRYDGLAFPFEADLCAHYRASRPVVREAVKMLTAKGLLSARRRFGTQVQPESAWSLSDPDVLRWLLERDFSLELLIDFTEMRLAIEPRAAALSARFATDAQRLAIAAAIDRMFAAEHDQDDALEADIAFHVAVLEASNNRFLRQFKELAEATLRFSIRRTNAFKGVPRASAADHAAVMDAILSNDAELASGRMFNLIQGALHLLIAADAAPTE